MIFRTRCIKSARPQQQFVDSSSWSISLFGGAMCWCSYSLQALLFKFQWIFFDILDTTIVRNYVKQTGCWTHCHRSHWEGQMSSYYYLSSDRCDRVFRSSRVSQFTLKIFCPGQGDVPVLWVLWKDTSELWPMNFQGKFIALTLL